MDKQNIEDLIRDQPELEQTIKDYLRKADEEKEAMEEYKKTFNPAEVDVYFSKLYMAEPFFGVISLNVTRKADFSMPTAYVGIERGKHDAVDPEFVMGFNPWFIKQLTPEQKIAVFKHEFYHLIFEHLTTYRTLDKSLAMLQNWAQDLSINSMLEYSSKGCLPELCLLPGRRGNDPMTGKPLEGPYADFIANAPTTKDSQWYFEELKKIKEEQEKKNGKAESEIEIMQSGIGTMDEHGGWADLPEELQEALRNKMKGITQKAAEHCERSQNWGSISSEMQERIKKLLSREVDWRAIVRLFFARTRSMNRVSTIKRINKKIPYLQPGCKRTSIANFAVFVDQSGSVSDSDLELFFGELASLSNEAPIDVFHFDTEVDEASKTSWTKSNKGLPMRTRCGGTDFDCVAKYLNKPEVRGKYSGAILLTDGYAPKISMGNTPKTKLLWIITTDGTTETARSGDLVVKLKGDKMNR